MINERPLEPPESEYKAYVFTCDCSCKVEICVYAKNLEQARESLNSKEWDDTNLIGNYEIEDELDYKIDD